MTKAHLIPTSKSTLVMLPSQGLRPNVGCSSSALCRNTLSGVTARLGCLPISLQPFQRGGKGVLTLLCSGHPQAQWRCETTSTAGRPAISFQRPLQAVFCLPSAGAWQSLQTPTAVASQLCTLSTFDMVS